MIVDDRLETVLRTVAAGPGAIRTQFRQLVDILGRTPAEGWSAAHVAALGRIDSLHAALGDAASGALIGTCTLRSPILIEHFAELGPKTALAAITSARLREAEWLQIIPDLPVPARGFLRHRRDLGRAVETLLARFGITDFALPLPQGYEPLAETGPEAPAEPAAPDAPLADAPPRLVAVPAASPAPAPVRGEGIGAIVQRIEAFRRTRQLQAAGGQIGAQLGPQPAGGTGQTRLPFVDEPAHTPPEVTAIDLRLDAEGLITAADAPYAAMLVGLRPFAADPDAPATCNEASIRAARARLPVDAGICEIEGTAALAGTWRIDAAPLFAAGTGHFQGYHARLRRPRPAAPYAAAAVNDDERSAAAASAGSADRLRQMLHELRTPINAIQGFAELIQQQLLGPTPHQYRSLAASIASDAARMLAGFEDIERLAGLEAGQDTGRDAEPHQTEPGEADLAGLLRKLVEQLEPALASRDIHLRCDIPDEPLRVPMEPLELERTLWRLISFITGSSAPGEELALSLAPSPTQSLTTRASGQAVLLLWLPAALATRDDAALFAPDAGAAGGGAPQSGAMLGGGFALRLAAAEIRASGGALLRRGAQLEVTLPLLTAVQRTPSQGFGPAGQAG